MIRRISSRRFEARNRRPASDYNWISKYPVLADLVDGALTEMEMEMLNMIVGLIMKAANETPFDHGIREGNGTPLQYSCLENPWMEEPGRL